ncbi:SusC/RagA family TonB-linked outer membrane protein [Arachidicoccus ginsenosidimutans]|uniref:SusC/RagA family TonB-linked outer membrane protein n=1 Tax=Arachidicoccus sp. BS20 TaxID=1850526 RepID=UPI000A73FEC7|nr:SusC/RagA family TonB-linked outer membrane protein [Arachidicoccus sp. BS20]
MKIITTILIIGCLQVSAKGLSQTITLSVKKAPLTDVFRKIEAQSGYAFFYNYALFNKATPVTLNLKEVPLKKALDKCFANQPLQYKIVNKNIVVQLKDEHTEIRKDAVAIQKTYQVSVHGHITDSAGKPLQGVSIVIDRKGEFESVIYTVSNENGDFEIAAQKGEKLLFSYIGYKQKIIEIGNDSEVNVVLEAQVHELESLSIGSINTGYQRIKPEQSTGAVSQITTKDYESRISTSFIDGLVNKIPGLMINPNVQFNFQDANGNQSSHSLFNIRGISTISANSQPLIVVDGYPTELTMDMIDPNEIKSVTVLKDAAAAAIYGVRASNGVIVIERKQAKVGKPLISFRATVGITPKENYTRYRWADDASAIVTNYQKNNYVVNADTWGQLSTKTRSSSFSPVYYILAQQMANVITPYQAQQSYAALEEYNNAKDYGKYFLRTAVTQTYNVDVSGGNPNALYYFTANYTGNRAEQIKNNDYKLLLTGRTTLKFSKKLSLELTTNYQESYINGAPVPDITSLYPYEHLKDVNGNPLSVSQGSNANPFYNNYIMSLGLEDARYYPLSEINEVTDRTHTISNSVTANFDYIIGSGFDLSFGGIYERSVTDMRHYASGNSSEARQYINSAVTQDNTGKLTFNIPEGGFLKQQHDNLSSYTLRAQLNYNKVIGSQHSFNAILGTEVRQVIDEGNIASYFGYDDQTLLQQPVDYGGLFSGNITGAFFGSSFGSYNYSDFFDQSYSKDRYLSGYTNIVYSFRNTYSVTGSVRIDQSNLFGTDPKYKYKPLWSVGAAWNINKEKFMENVSWIKMLKLRIADGFNGNVAKSSLPEVIAESQTNIYTSPYTSSLVLKSNANRSLRWEQTNNFNIGLDYALFKHIYGSVDFYNKKTTDAMSSAQIDPTIGTSPSIINSADINNKGIEISLHADWISNEKFNWNTGFILARNTSKVQKVYRDYLIPGLNRKEYSPMEINNLGFVQGAPVGALFAYRYAGLDSLGYPTVKNTKGTIYHTEDNTTGSPTYYTFSNDTSNIVRDMGSSIPTINAGISNRWDIGSFYIYCMLNYYGGFKVFVPRPNPAATRPLKGAGDYWKQPGDETKTDVMALSAYSNYYANGVYNYADKYLVNGDYITLGDIVVSYSMDKNKFIKKIGFSHFEIKLQASNVWTVGLNKYNYSAATGGYQKSYVTPTYTLGIFTNF